MCGKQMNDISVRETFLDRINEKLTHIKYSDTCLREVILLRNLFFKVQTLKSYEVHKAKRKLLR